MVEMYHYLPRLFTFKRNVVRGTMEKGKKTAGRGRGQERVMA
jgi:hypothetical protein